MCFPTGKHLQSIPVYHIPYLQECTATFPYAPPFKCTYLVITEYIFVIIENVLAIVTIMMAITEYIFLSILSTFCLSLFFFLVSYFCQNHDIFCTVDSSWLGVAGVTGWISCEGGVATSHENKLGSRRRLPPEGLRQPAIGDRRPPRKSPTTKCYPH